MCAADPRPGCPVCGTPIPPSTGRPVDRGAEADLRCGGCGWVLRTPRRLGPVTPAIRGDFDRRLTQAQQALDAAAAARVSPDPSRFARWIRGGTPDASVWAAARRQAAEATAGALDEEAARKELAELLRWLGAGQTLTIVEVGPGGVGVTRAVMDAAGVPRFEPDPAPWSWPDLLPGLSGDPEERLLQLAGGQAGLDAAALGRWLTETAPAPEAGAALVICRPAGWRVLEEAAARACLGLEQGRLLRIAADPAGVSAAGVLGPLTAAMPLLRGYGVVVAAVDPVTGTVQPQTRPLFRPGDAPGARRSMLLRRFPGDDAPATLAVAVDGDWGAASPDVVALHSVPVPKSAVYQVSAVLEGPGRIRFTEPNGITDQGGSWDDVATAMPREVDVRPGPVDLVCAIELAGPKAQVDLRRDLVRDLVRLVVEEYPEAAAPRIGLLGCLDHVFAPGEEKRRVVRAVPLGPAEHALAGLDRLRGADIGYRDAAPIEDLLHEATRMLAGARPAGRAGRLLLVTGRRPHPPVLVAGRVPGATIVQPCPFRYDWQAQLRQLAGAGVAVVTVADVRPAVAGRPATGMRTAFLAARAP
jgi:hypothetical protein